MRIKALLLAVLVVSGCAIPKAREFRAWDQSAYESASSGAMLWSDYYAQRFERLKDAPSLVLARGVQMQQALKLREVALEVEAGKRPVSDLKSAQQQADADVQVERDREGTAMSAAAAGKQPAKTTICRPVGPTVICN